MDEPLLLSVDDLVVSFERPVVRGLSLRLESGKVLALVGESGSGKTMSCLTILGLLPQNARHSGSVRLSGEKLADFSEEDLAKRRRRRVAMVFQEPRAYLDPSMKIGDQIREILRFNLGQSRREAARRCPVLLESVGLGASRVASAYPQELSGGMCQRASIALAISCDPSLLIADEPTTALDASVQRSILDLLLDTVTERRMGMIFVTHDLRAADYVADTVAVMLDGLIVEEGKSSDVLSSPLHPYTRLLLDSLPDEGFLSRKRPMDEAPAAPGGCPFSGRCPLAESACRASLPPLFSHPRGRKARCIKAGAPR